MNSERPWLYEIREPNHVHIFSEQHRRSGDQKIFVDRFSSRILTIGIWSQRHQKICAMTGIEAVRLQMEIGPVVKPITIRGCDQFSQEVIFDLDTDEVIGLLSVLASWK